jgi:hypothetical protein
LVASVSRAASAGDYLVDFGFTAVDQEPQPSAGAVARSKGERQGGTASRLRMRMIDLLGSRLR